MNGCLLEELGIETLVGGESWVEAAEGCVEGGGFLTEGELLVGRRRDEGSGGVVELFNLLHHSFYFFFDFHLRIYIEREDEIGSRLPGSEFNSIEIWRGDVFFFFFFSTKCLILFFLFFFCNQRLVFGFECDEEGIHENSISLNHHTLAHTHTFPFFSFSISWLLFFGIYYYYSVYFYYYFNIKHVKV